MTGNPTETKCFTLVDYGMLKELQTSCAPSGQVSKTRVSDAEDFLAQIG
jgi:hypothetical protein